MATANPLTAPGLPPAVAAQLQAAGLELLEHSQRLSQLYPDLLQHSPLLHDFSPAQIDTLGSVMQRVRAQSGQVLIAEDELGDWMLLLLSGTVDVTKRSYRPESLDADQPAAPPEEVSRLAVVKSGASLGEMSMLDGELRYATCTALEPVEAGVLTRQAVASLIAQHPAVGAKLLVKITQLLAQRLRNTSNKLVKLLEPQALLKK